MDAMITPRGRRYSYVCISMRSCTERRALMDREFRKARVTYRYFDAIALPDETTVVPGYDPEKRLRMAGYPLTRGELGCYLSHRAVWQQLLDAGEDAYCVVEDDVSFEPGFRENVEAIVDRSDHFDLVRIGSTRAFYKDALYADLGTGSRVHWTRRGAIGTWCYTITPRCAAALLAYTAEILHPIDLAIDRCWEHGQKVHMLYPAGARTAGLPTTITGRDQFACGRPSPRDRVIGRLEKWRYVCFVKKERMKAWSSRQTRHARLRPDSRNAG